MKRTTAAWVKKAEEDYMAALKLASNEPQLHNTVCFHCEQSAEKYLKALMEELGMHVPRTHILLDLRRLLLPHYPELGRIRRSLDFLTRFAVDTRYPGDNASKRQARAALRWAEEVRTMARSLLGLRPPRTQSKKSP